MVAILDAAAQLGYRASWSARTLNAANGGFTGIVIADLYSPAFAPIVVGAYKRLGQAGRQVLMSVTSLSEPGGGRQLEDAAVAFLGDLRPDSMIVVGSVRDMSLLEPLAKQVPTVVAGARPVDLTTTAKVFTDDRAGLRMGIEHLVELGHRRIAHISGIGRVGDARARAYVDAMKGFGLQTEVRVEPSDFEEGAGYHSVLRLLDSPTPPTAITAAGDHAAIGGLAALRDRGRTDVSIVGYGDAPVAAFHLARLTTIRPDNDGIGAAAADSVLGATAEERPGSEIRIPPTLIIRASTTPVGS